MSEVLGPTIRSFQVLPDIPEPLQPLVELAHNLWWVWQPDAIELFRRLDRKLWDQVYHNPVKLLGVLSQESLGAAARDEGYIAHLRGVRAARIAADLFRRPRDSCGRSLEKRQRTWPAAERGGAVVSQWIFPAVPVGRRLAAGGLSGAGLLQPRGRADALHRRHARSGARRSAGQRGLLPRVESQRGSDSA